MKTILLIAAVVFSTQALATVTDILPSVVYTPTESTQVLKVDFITTHGVSCPGGLSLITQRNNQGFISVEYTAAKENTSISKLTEKLSNSCRNEVSAVRLQELPDAICLSYGFPKGSVYIAVSNGKPVKFEFPVNITVEQVTELK